MGRWIDDLAVEQVDTDDQDGPDATFYPITGLLGSVQLLTDENGAVVQRITYDPDGTPHFWSKDGAQPSVTRIAWTGDGTLPTGDTVTAQAFEIGLSEPIDPASVTNATATLTPDGGTPQTLTLTLAADSRTAYLTGATVAAGTQYTLHVDGLTDTTHNLLWPEDATITVANPNAYEVLDDTTAPQLLAVLDGSDALYLLFDEPVEPAAGYDMTTALSIVRSGQPVDGAATRMTANLLEWQPGGGVGGLIPGGTYTLSAVHLTDLASNAATAGATFTHLNTNDQMLLLVYQAPTDTQPEAQSAYGLTTLFQGRTWHGDLGMYYYRARWYLPETGVFGERDPVGHEGGPNLYPGLFLDPQNLLDPYGLLHLVLWTSSISRSDENTFHSAAIYLSNERRGRGEQTLLRKVTSGREIVDVLAAQAPDSVESLDVFSHSNPGGIHIARRIAPDKSPWLRRIAHYQIRRRDTRHPQTWADAEYMEEELAGLYSGLGARQAVAVYYNQKIARDSALLKDVPFDRFKTDAIVEFQGCRSGMSLPIVDSFAEDFSEKLAASGKDKALVISHVTASCPLPGTQDYRHGRRRVFRDGEVVLETSKTGPITHADIH